MARLTPWPVLLLAANVSLMVLGTGMALGSRHGALNDAQPSHAITPQHIAGDMSSMMMPRNGSGGSMSTSTPMPMAEEGSPIMHMPILGPAHVGHDSSPTSASSRRHASVGVNTLLGPRTASHVRTFTLTARPQRLVLAKGSTVDAWTFNGTAPGPVLRVRQGDLVVVHLVNRLSVPTTIHWHGIAVPGGEDGVAGLTQDAVLPGHTYTYRFVATQSGTYWYHAHQDSLTQVQHGLFGAIVVEPRQPAPRDAVDRTITVHTWSIEGRDVLAANDSAQILHIPARPGTFVRLRFVNTDSTMHVATLAGTPFMVVALDGHELHGPTSLQRVALPLGAGQRYDLRFRMPRSGAVALRLADVADDQHRLVHPLLAVVVGAGVVPADGAKPAFFNLAAYGTPVPAAQTPYDRPGSSYSLVLGAQGGFSLAHPGVTFTINGKTAPNIAPIVVKRGEVVHLHITNQTTVVHPMHLHGHTFAVLRRDGRRLTGSPILLDTLNVFPNETYDVAFIADNPGVWMLHCHNLYHARQGMGLMVMYEGVETPFKNGGPVGNISD